MPGYERINLKAFVQEISEREGYISHLICIPWFDDALYLVDEVVMRTVQGDLAEVDVWKVGADDGWVVFYKGPSQSQAWTLKKVRNAWFRSEVRPDFSILGLVVGRLDYLPPHRLRRYEWSEEE